MLMTGVDKLRACALDDDFISREEKELDLLQFKRSDKLLIDVKTDFFLVHF